MYTIKKEFSFSASHVLDHLPEGHPCSRMHGHNYQVIVELTSNGLNESGFVVDYRELDRIKKWIDDKLDHRHLNTVFHHMNPSAENLARLIFKQWKNEFPHLSAVTVSETPKTSARYEP